MSTRRKFIASKALFALVFYLIIPLCSLLFIMHAYPELPQERLSMRIYWVIPTATVLVIFAQLSSLYQKGDTKRFLLNIGFTVSTMIWMFGLLGGALVMTTQWNGYDFSLHMDKYVFLSLCVAILNLLYYTLEWKVCRKNRNILSSAQKNRMSHSYV